LAGQSAARRPRKAPQPDALLAAACRIVEAEGLAGLTLRPLALALEVSVTVLNTHYGTRADVIAAICRAAGALDAVHSGRWKETLSALGAMPSSLAADVAEAMLEALVTEQRATTILYLELLQGCTWDATLHAAFAEWDAQRRQLWQQFAQGAGLAPSLVACGWWYGYVVTELAYGVALNPLLPYRMLRRLCLQRVFQGGAAAAQDGADARLFGRLLVQLRQGDDAIADHHPAGWQARAARASGIHLAARGAGGLTHRAIAAEIGVPHTTLSYHFPRQHDLVFAGLLYIAAHLRTAADADTLSELQRLRTEGDGAKLDLARASFAMAIAAIRMPELVSRSASARSRRGDILGRVFEKHMPDVRNIDGLCAQVVSLGLSGLGNLAPPGAASEQSVAAAFAAAARWLQQQ